MKPLKPYSSNWGWWFTGLVDGEGSFVISYRPAGANNPFDDYRPMFSLGLRSDDRAVVEEAHKVFGGNVHVVRYQKPSKDQKVRKPQAQWQIQSRKETMGLVTHFDAFPLRSKKANDYRYWRLAVLEAQKPHKTRSQERIRLLRAAIKEARKFEADADFTALIHDPQLSLELGTMRNYDRS